MKVIILNSGIGSRLGDLTKYKPKLLVNITRNETIFSKSILFFLNWGLMNL